MRLNPHKNPYLATPLAALPCLPRTVQDGLYLPRPQQYSSAPEVAGEGGLLYCYCGGSLTQTVSKVALQSAHTDCLFHRSPPSQNAASYPSVSLASIHINKPLITLATPPRSSTGHLHPDQSVSDLAPIWMLWNSQVTESQSLKHCGAESVTFASVSGIFS